MDDQEQPWQIVLNRDTEHAAPGEPAAVERSVEQSLGESLFAQLLEPFETGLNNSDVGMNAEAASEQELPWILGIGPYAGNPKDRQSALPTANDVEMPMIKQCDSPSVKSESGGAPPPCVKSEAEGKPIVEPSSPPTGRSETSDSRKRSAHARDRPRLRAPKGDPSKKHKCPVQGCSYSANGTGHLYRHMLTHNGRKDHKVRLHAYCLVCKPLNCGHIRAAVTLCAHVLPLWPVYVAWLRLCKQSSSTSSGAQ